jgi:uncharacterized protein
VTPHLSDFGAALALVFVLEGIFPFLSPGSTRRVLAKFTAFGDHELRMAGFCSMLVGVALLFLV